MKKILYIITFLLTLLFFQSCKKNTVSNRKVSFIKYLEPGVNNSFAAHAISGNSYALFGIKQITKYDFGQLNSTIISIYNDEISLDTIIIPPLSIAFPSNLVINNDNSTVLFALSENQDLLAIEFDSEGKFLQTKALAGYEGMCVLSAVKKADGYWILINDKLATDYSTRTYLIKADLNFSNLTNLITQEYNAKSFTNIVGENLFNSYFLYSKLQEYSFIRNYNGEYITNSPITIGGIIKTTTIGLQKITETGINTVNSEILLSVPFSYIKEMDIDANGITYPVVFDYQSSSLDFYTYKTQTTELKPLKSISTINPYKKLLFAKNNTSEIQEKIVVSTNYDNKTQIYSPIDETINFTFGGTYESEVTAAFWGGPKSDQLIIFGNSYLYNQFPANFIIMLPKESLTQ